MTDNARHFSAAFLCPQCGHEIGIMTWMAIVEGPGLEVGCIVCRTLFIVTKDGATPITEDAMKQIHDFLDAAGAKFTPRSTESEPNCE